MIFGIQKLPPLESQAEYVQALKTHDWSHEMSEDHSVWQRGAAELERLRLWQQRNDPLYEVWNSHAPTLYQAKL